jgi:hypothetical protein
MVCSSCGTDNPAGRKFCGLCGKTMLQQNSGSILTQATPGTGAQTDSGAFVSYADRNNGFSAPVHIVNKKYKALRTIAILYKVLGIIVGLLCCGGGFLMFVAAVGSQGGNRNDLNVMIGGFGIAGAFISFVYGIVLFIFLYGLGEFISVFIDIEENTRITNEMLATKPGR